VKRLLYAVLALLERSGVPYCLLHGWERLGEFPASDVDLAVRPQDLGIVEALLFRQLEPFCVQLYHYKSTGYCFTLAALDGQARRFLRLDLTTYYRGNGRLFMNAAELMAGRRLVNGIWVSSPRVELSYLLIKKVLKGTVPPSQKQRLRALVDELGPQAAVIAARFFGRAGARRLLSLINGGEWGPLEQSMPSLQESLLRHLLLRNPLRWLRYWLPELWRLWKRWLHPAGLFVAVLGTDGSGKSTLLRRLPSALRPVFPGNAVFHLRPRLLPASRNSGPTGLPHSRGPRAGLASLLKLLYLILDYGLGYLFKVRPLLTRASLVCFDRYFQDLLADPRRYRHCGPPWLLRLAGRLVPRPDLFLVLDVPEQELVRRKQELPPEEVRRQRAAYRGLAAELPNAVLLPVQATESLAEARAAEAILAHLQWRYGRRRHLWFPLSAGPDWNWLATVLCVDKQPTTGRPVVGRSGRKEYWRLDLRDGRGYLLPLAPPRSAAAALGLYGAQSLKARVAKSCLAAGLGIGLVQPLLPRPRQDWTASSCQAFLPDHLMQVLERQDLRFAISLGTPGPHRKPVIQALERNGSTLAFAKIGWDPSTCELLGNEAEILRRLEDRKPQAFTAPRLLHLERWHERLICLQSPPSPKARLAGQDLDTGYLEVLQELAALESRRLPLSQSMFWKSLSGWMSRMQVGWPGYALLPKLERVAKRLDSVLLPFHFCHGDFVPWNVRVTDGLPFLFDWEYARAQWLPGYDLLHFLFQTHLLLTGQGPAGVYRSVLKQIIGSTAARTYWEKLQIEEASLPALVQFYLLERAIYHSYVSPGHYPALQGFLALVEIAFSVQEPFP
jgi:thymidylate kinase